MSKLESFIQEKEQRNEAWKTQKEAEREDLNHMSDNGIMAATQQPGFYLRYLNVQADHPRYSATNILLILEQNPEITQVDSLENWNKLGRSVKREESGLKIRVSERYVKEGKEYRGYKIGRVFDVGQTTGKGPLPGKLTLAENTAQMDAALRQLLELAPVKVVTNTTMRSDAFYDPNAQEISVSAHLTDGQTFAALAREIVHAKIHDHGRYPYYSREDCRLDADSVCYMLCHSFGVPCSQPDASRIGVLLDGMEPSDRRSILDSLQQIFKQMQGSVQKEITSPQKQTEHGQPAR